MKRLIQRVRAWLTKPQVPPVPLRTYPDDHPTAVAGGPASWTRPEDPDVKRGEGQEI